MHHAIANPNVPKTKGPYSQVTRLDRLLFVSGQASTDPVTGDFIPGSFDVQARQAFENLSTALRAARQRARTRGESDCLSLRSR